MPNKFEAHMKPHEAERAYEIEASIKEAYAELRRIKDRAYRRGRKELGK